ncbi:DUF4145 domain-containing protein [Streptomyces sp. NRRL S-118]|uniref:DUF4145 domain-containing protein n=1 Tax=Streptomyces sp. NRRL S-118 TaxID=1463881 RepID=UPI00131C7CDC|nr:DUF4145 domain-containing protein [Streptomyces sp. NRRL S-118]
MSILDEWVIRRDGAPGQVGRPADFKLWGCLACGQPQLWYEPENQRLWPPVTALAPGVPTSIAREMVEARACFDANLYTAAAVMVRRTLEGMCIDQGTQKKALFQALQELRDNGKIEGRLFDWAQALRVLGNQGAHFSEESVSREDAADALSLAEALLNYIYVFTAKYEEFQKRRQASAN